MKKTILLIALHFVLITFGQKTKDMVEITNKNQEALVEEFVSNCAEKYNYNYNMAEWQSCLDAGLKNDSTAAYLWQQKAMPYFKAKKYEIGMRYIDKAVKFNPERWQSYRAFIKCVFAKTYSAAILDFEDCKKRFGNGYVMDHTYNFYIGLCYLQLNEYAKAEQLFKEYIDDIFKNREGLEHPTALFYFGIAKYEQKKLNEAIIEFDKTLKIYPNFSDAKYYKAICLAKLGKVEEYKVLMKESEQDGRKGYTINEDNTLYETYPYQKKWKD